MYFTSYAFIAFAAVTLILYYILPRRWQQHILLLSSLLFFASYRIEYLGFIVFTALTTYIFTRVITSRHEKQDAYLAEHKGTTTKEERRAYKDGVTRVCRVYLTVCLLLNFGILAVLKYTNFTIHNINSLLSLEGDAALPMLELLLPIGISFYTFMCMGYCVDVYRRKYEADKSFLHVMLFTCYFPQLVQGPFSRYDELGETLFSSHGFDSGEFSAGISRIVWGYFKKLVIADRVVIALRVIIGAPDEYTGAYVFAGIILYAMRIYADFTGGIDITMGISRALGIKLQENFIRPYFSKSIAEYWRRWHISLGVWFREYLFYPLSIWGPINRLGKRLKPKLGAGFAKRLPVYFSTITVWAVTGIWHGASWNFLLWGLTNCAVILISQECSPLYAKFHEKTHIGEGGVYGAFMMLRTFLLMSCIRMYDCYATIGQTYSAFGSMFTKMNAHVLFDGSMLKLGLSAADFVILAAGAVLMFTVSVLGERMSMDNRLAGRPALRAVLISALALITLVFGVYGVGYDASQFIYTTF